jgi:hypothetical protein
MLEIRLLVIGQISRMMGLKIYLASKGSLMRKHMPLRLQLPLAILVAPWIRTSFATHYH